MNCGGNVCRERGRSVSCNDMSFAEVNLFLGEHLIRNMKHLRLDQMFNAKWSIYLGEVTILMQTALLTLRMFVCKQIIGLHLKNPHEIWIYLPGLRKIFKHKFYENPSSGYRFVPCGRIDGPNMTKLIVGFRNFAKPLKMGTTVQILCNWNTIVCAADSSCFFTVTAWWPDCDTEWLICINVAAEGFLCIKLNLRI